MQLFLFTNFFPLKRSEPFLVNEFEYTKQYFKSINILPLYGVLENEKIENAIIHKPIFKAFKTTQIIFEGLFNLKSIKYHLNEVLKQNLLFKPKKLYWNISGCFIARAFQKHPIFNLIIQKSKTQKCVLYFYWGDGMVNAIPYLLEKTNKQNLKIIIRFHGSDLYENFKSNYSPLRDLIFTNADKLITISEAGKNYLCSKYPQHKTKINLSRLGVLSQINTIENYNKTDIITIVSVSNIIPLKRVNLIFESLQHVKSKINWHHFGAGSGFEDLNQKIKNNSSTTLKIKLHGFAPNAEIINFYKSTQIDLFINLSTSEGIPVSIMEAYSFGIPAIATNVGGTAELVTNKNGRLIDVTNDSKSIAKTIGELIALPIIEFKLLKKEAYQTFELNFSAEKNYKHFYEMVLNQS
jgi:colanic acid/amylovoran biosynthesis glycosyltransferase